MPRKTAEQKFIEVWNEKGLDWLRSQVRTLEILSAPAKTKKGQPVAHLSVARLEDPSAPPLPEKH